jgi:hypothetical protein
VREIAFGSQEFQLPDAECRYLATGLLNQVGDVYLAVNDFTEFPSLVSLQKLKDVPVYVSRCSDGAEIFSIWALYGEAYDSRAP